MQKKKFKKCISNSNNLLQDTKYGIVIPQNEEKTNCWLGQNENKPDVYAVKKKNRTILPKNSSSKRYQWSQQPTPSMQITIKTEDFGKLKQQISELENKAKKNYGMSFDINKENNDEFIETMPTEPR